MRFCVCLCSVSTLTRTSWDSYKLFGFNFWLVTWVGWAVTLCTKTICFLIPFGIFLFLLFVCLVAKTTKSRACFYQNLRIQLFAKRPFLGLWIYQIGCRYQKQMFLLGIEKITSKVIIVKILTSWKYFLEAGTESWLVWSFKWPIRTPEMSKFLPLKMPIGLCPGADHLISCQSEPCRQPKSLLQIVFPPNLKVHRHLFLPFAYLVAK